MLDASNYDWIRTTSANLTIPFYHFTSSKRRTSPHRICVASRKRTLESFYFFAFRVRFVLRKREILERRCVSSFLWFVEGVPWTWRGQERRHPNHERRMIETSPVFFLSGSTFPKENIGDGRIETKRSHSFSMFSFVCSRWKDSDFPSTDVFEISRSVRRYDTNVCFSSFFLRSSFETSFDGSRSFVDENRLRVQVEKRKKTRSISTIEVLDPMERKHACMRVIGTSTYESMHRSHPHTYEVSIDNTFLFVSMGWILLDPGSQKDLSVHSSFHSWLFRSMEKYPWRFGRE